MYFLLGLSIVLAAMLIVNTISSLGATLLWRGLEKNARSWSAESRARLLTTLRILPVTAGLTIVALLFGPAYLTHEPRADHEDVSAKLAILALFSVIGIGLALVRGIVTWRVTTRLRNDWLRNAQPINLAGINIPTYQRIAPTASSSGWPPSGRHTVQAWSRERSAQSVRRGRVAPARSAPRFRR